MFEQDKPRDVQAALLWAASYLQQQGVDNPRFDAEVLLAQVLKTERIELYLSPKRYLSPLESQSFLRWIQRRGEREPLQYITGTQEFMSLNFTVTPAVLIPRQDTEVLVEQCLEWASHQPKSLQILDLCTGSGAIAVSLAYYLPKAEVWAVDISPAALQVAKLNAEKHLVNISFLQGDLAQPVAGQRFNLVTANPPYIPAAEITKLSPEVGGAEPKLALDGGTDGLDFYRRLARELPAVLQAGGRVMLEIGWNQGQQVEEILLQAGFSEVRVLQDLGGRDRVVAADWTFQGGIDKNA
ncbi:MAG TPA: peptide chain release factor N(5)-glutamine methyltransferase [Candidatus Deferrimicrobium sp.]|nr:peptide chain release factor N(5)-glutamine methyltransferase [Candidatus Deferrimicrobium sp.]